MDESKTIYCLRTIDGGGAGLGFELTELQISKNVDYVIEKKSFEKEAFRCM